MSHVAVLGAGAWGTALADHLARKGEVVRLWAYEPEVAESVNARHENALFFAGRTLADSLTASNDLHTVLAGARVVVSVVPSHVTRRVWGQAATRIAPGTPLIVATKGLEPESLAMMSEVAAEAVPQSPFVALSGPSFADEVHQGQPTAVVAASLDVAAAETAQRLFATSSFRVYRGDDVIGVELGGSLKNTMAIAAGILEGLGMGHNPCAALITRGLAEMSRLGAALGARSETFAGLAGMGDLILTCTGGLSRNRQLGVLLAQGMTLAEYRATHRNVAEGVNTAQAAVALARRHGVEMPIAEEVAAVLFEGADPRTSVQRLMERSLKAERDG